jgi:hypothetical protein
MPSEKEIEEAIDWIKNEEFGAVGNSHTYTLIDVYLSMKSERDEIAKENERLRDNAAQVVIEELVYKDGQFDATMKTGFGPILATFVREMMKAYKGENFVTTSLLFADDTDAYYLTFGRKHGKSVDEKYVEVCGERDKYKAIVDMVKAAHREVADDGRVWAECRDIDKVIALALREKES